jgi:hypothetical protein
VDGGGKKKDSHKQRAKIRQGEQPRQKDEDGTNVAPGAGTLERLRKRPRFDLDMERNLGGAKLAAEKLGISG